MTSEEGIRTCFRVQDPTLPGSLLYCQVSFQGASQTSKVLLSRWFIDYGNLALNDSPKSKKNTNCKEFQDSGYWFPRTRKGRKTPQSKVGFLSEGTLHTRLHTDLEPCILTACFINGIHCRALSIGAGPGTVLYCAPKTCRKPTLVFALQIENQRLGGK